MALPPIFSSTHLPPFLLTTHRLLSNSSNFCNRASRRDEATLKIGGHSGFHARARESWQLRRAETEPRALRWLAGPSVCPDVHGPSEVDFWCYRSFRCPPTRRVVTACFTTSHISLLCHLLFWILIRATPFWNSAYVTPDTPIYKSLTRASPSFVLRPSRSFGGGPMAHRGLYKWLNLKVSKC